jgi:TIR domain-containing protein
MNMNPAPSKAETRQNQPVFMSYARSDSDFALKLAQDLRTANVALWIDQLDIGAGDTWDHAVEEALQECAGLLVILSPSAVASRSVMDEVSFALEEGKKVYPVLYRDCQVPFRLRRVQHISFVNDYSNGLSRLLRALAGDVPTPTPVASGDTMEELRRKSRRLNVLAVVILAVACVMAVMSTIAVWRTRDRGPRAAVLSTSRAGPKTSGAPTSGRPKVEPEESLQPVAPPSRLGNQGDKPTSKKKRDPELAPRRPGVILPPLPPAGAIPDVFQFQVPFARAFYYDFDKLRQISSVEPGIDFYIELEDKHHPATSRIQVSPLNGAAVFVREPQNTLGNQDPTGYQTTGTASLDGQKKWGCLTDKKRYCRLWVEIDGEETFIRVEEVLPTSVVLPPLPPAGAEAEAFQLRFSTAGGAFCDLDSRRAASTPDPGTDFYIALKEKDPPSPKIRVAILDGAGIYVREPQSRAGNQDPTGYQTRGEAFLNQQNKWACFTTEGRYCRFWAEQEGGGMVVWVEILPRP